MARPVRRIAAAARRRSLRQTATTAPVQTALLTSIANGVLVFCGLITAIAAAILSSADKVVAPEGMPLWLGGAAALALIAGILVLGAMTGAHNLARRAERRDTRKRIDRARRFAAYLSTGANLVAAMAAFALLWGLGMFVLSPPAPAPVPHPAPASPTMLDLRVSQTCAPAVTAYTEPFCK